MIQLKSLALSRKELLKFILPGLVLAPIMGKLLYDDIKWGVVFFGLYMFLIKGYRQRLNDEKRQVLLSQFKDVLFSISSSIAVGRSMSQALRESVTFWQGTYDENDMMISELNYMANQIEAANESDINVLRDFADRADESDIRDFVSVYEITKQTGANLIKAIGRASDIISEKIELTKELKSLVKQKSFEGRIVGLAPFAIIITLRLVSPGYLEPMTGSTMGKLLMTVALGIMVSAIAMITRITNIDINGVAADKSKNVSLRLREEAKFALPELVNQILLLLNCGISLNDTFMHIANTFGESMDQSMFKREVYKLREISLNTGENVLSLFKNFAEFTKSKELMRVANIMLENQKFGTDCTEKLSEIQENAWKDRRQMLREKIRLADSKLTFPLGLLLIALLIVTTAPAMLETLNL